MRVIHLLVLLPLCYALFEDQIGKFDWRHQFVGCPRNVIFDRDPKGDHLLISTKQNFFASLSVSTGAIDWRRIQENSNLDSDIPIVLHEDVLYGVADGGRYLRTWNKVSGSLKWQKPLSDSVNKHPSIVISGSHIVSLSADKIHAFTTDGEDAWVVDVSKSEWHAVYQSKTGLVYASIKDGQLSVSSIKDGTRTSTKTSAITYNQQYKCVLDTSLICWSQNNLQVVNIGDSLTVKEVTLSFSIRDIIVLGQDKFAVLGHSSTHFYSTSDLKQIYSIGQHLETLSASGNTVFAISQNKALFYDINSGALKNQANIKSTGGSPVDKIYLSAVKDEIEALVVYQDCTLNFIVYGINTNVITSEWTREEGLARVSSVEMVDLPLSESQQMIEDEFEERNDNAFHSFVRRVVAQTIQVQKWFLRTIHSIASFSSHLSISHKSFGEILSSFKESMKATSDGDESLERDFFNLRKMIVVTSLDGVVYGLDSRGGKVIWKLNLGDNFSPLETELHEQKVLLFIQRSTAHYQLNGQAVVVFKDKNSNAGQLIFFNTITGESIEKKHLKSRILKADLLPVVGKDHLHTLLIIEELNKVSMYPFLSDEAVSQLNQVHTTTLTPKGLSGAIIDLSTLRVQTTWDLDLHLSATEKVVAIKGKSPNEKVHSQGRVLIDRNVQYKYVNPNLVVVASLDSVNLVLNLYMIDSVTGHVVYSAKVEKVSGPIHLVHCENWVTYSYWSEKGRRTEIGVVELYEGDELTNKEVFDSHIPTKKAPEVNAQSYIYAQGVEAMSVTETEQGLTTRSILLALPFGGIHEVSRKFLDANRPLELTQEMREEMMIPYMPEIFIATEDLVNYNQTVHQVRGIKTAPSGLESTSLMLAYGADLFFTRLHPSGTFDILKDDFDHLLISLVLFALIAGSVVTKRLARNNALKTAWA